MSDSGLKPCPFCGSEASMARDYCADSGGTFLSIKCSGCRAQSGEKYHSRGNDCPQTYQEVRDAWSRRADLRAPDPRVLALVEAAKPFALLKETDADIAAFAKDHPEEGGYVIALRAAIAAWEA